MDQANFLIIWLTNQRIESPSKRFSLKYARFSYFYSFSYFFLHGTLPVINARVGAEYRILSWFEICVYVSENMSWLKIQDFS